MFAKTLVASAISFALIDNAQSALLKADADDMQNFAMTTDTDDISRVKNPDE